MSESPRGYSLIHTITQRDAFVTKLLNDVHLPTQLHSQHYLSVRGHATIVNSLILSRLWHVLCLVWFPKTFINTLRSIVGNFVMRPMFSRVKYATLCLPWSVGGLDLIDPAALQYALQLRWLIPLLFPACATLYIPIRWLCAHISISVTSPKWRLCGHSNQTPEHFLVECPLIWQVWTMTMSRWIPQWPARPSTILRAFYALTLSPSPPHIDSYYVLDGVLATVWKAYWRKIFDNVPFVSANIVVSVNKLLQFFFQSSHLLD
ncbi:hypothetical protein PHYBLDRAFT_171000 [Phycomyces blakesleeanus NRRL 1555(-)]|uniref:Reverse transcriptase zinc-binding domain-containing protein n=1 Tax=Phycomyces blakesleeanus (strain ATCC 8743b / DSM 1359 / FGSC 10004 / NBRC 33097 / NRRL 1555) TaxID=763407 RepID=A0A162TTS5_PHYB8|nr:hypothetical protein PHYBLDRAFT_171000 [Phycomyces blakesleeanus NRRL 1555(-)]OAD70922.1 hypothetical protein PHYBLDRAFT_171000 [Phycomyces blakesleeanus NRRL 1555(-)]|eukprot:XP_018288962.1 hypothetical protein PHYBLDRAFT_171000 [Phycomyces blakesleeanus NRRL 1555(-)]